MRAPPRLSSAKPTCFVWLLGAQASIEHRYHSNRGRGKVDAEKNLAAQAHQWFRERLEKVETACPASALDATCGVLGVAEVQAGAALDSCLVPTTREQRVLASAFHDVKDFKFIRILSQIGLDLRKAPPEQRELTEGMRYGIWRAPLQFKLFRTQNCNHWWKLPVAAADGQMQGRLRYAALRK